MFIILKTDYFQLWILYKSDTRISSAGKQIEIKTLNLDKWQLLIR